MAQRGDEPTPVTVLTGFLGAGKTTLLRHVLRHIDAERVVVVENEFGAARIDTELLDEIAPGMVRTVLGCICCAVQGDLRHTFRSLVAARAAGTINFDRVLLETTGMAEPGAIVETFCGDDDVAAAFRVDAVVTVADARQIRVDLANSPTAQAQVALADVLVVSKTDLVTPEVAAEVEAQLAAANPMATRIRALHGQVDPAQVLDLDAFSRVRLVPAARHVHEDFTSVVLTDPGPHDLRRVRAWIRRLARARPYDLYRYKGLVHTGRRPPRRVVLQGVHDLFSLEAARAWRVDEVPATTLVLIGVHLDGAQLQAELEATRA